MKTATFPAKLLSCLMIAILPAFTMNIAGCQGKLTPQQVVGVAVAQLQGALPYLDQAPAIANDLRLLDPSLAADVEKWAPLIKQNAQNAIKLGNAYLAGPSGDGYQQLLNAVDALGATIDQQILSASKITNPVSAQKVLGVLGFVSVGVHIAVAVLKQQATSAQMKNLPQISRVDFRKIRPFLNRNYARDQLLAMHVPDSDAVLASVGM